MMTVTSPEDPKGRPFGVFSPGGQARNTYGVTRRAIFIPGGGLLEVEELQDLMHRYHEKAEVAEKQRSEGRAQYVDAWRAALMEKVEDRYKEQKAAHRTDPANKKHQKRVY